MRYALAVSLALFALPLAGSFHRPAAVFVASKAAILSMSASAPSGSSFVFTSDRPTSSWNGYQITVQGEGPTTVPAGLPVSVQVTVLKNGTPDPSWSYLGLVRNPEGTDLTWSASHNDQPDAAGQLPATVTDWRPGSVRPWVGIHLAPGVSAAVRLPAMTFTGASTEALPGMTGGPKVSPWWINQAWDAWPVLNQVSNPPTIALLTNGYPPTASVNTWLEAHGLPPLNVSVAAGLTLPTNSPLADNQEITIDLLALGVSAPGAHVILYPFTQNFGQALNDALAGTATVVSISYAVPADQWSAAEQAAAVQSWTPAITQANQRGMTVVAAAGDQGPYTTLSGVTPTTDGPSLLAVLPNVTAVGGADWRANPDGSAFASAYWGSTEYAGLAPGTLPRWVAAADGEGNMLGGGGVSPLVGEPDWQTTVAGILNGRGVPDLSGPASRTFPAWTPNLGGVDVPTGGTSLATPLMAGWIAECGAVAGHGLGNVNPALYQLAKDDPAAFSEPVAGNNQVDQVASSAPWNPLTGLGAPRVAAMCAGLTGHRFGSPPQPRITTTVQRSAGHWLVCARGAAGSVPLADIPARLMVDSNQVIGTTWDPEASPGVPGAPGLSAETNQTGSACWAVTAPAGTVVHPVMAGTKGSPVHL